VLIRLVKVSALVFVLSSMLAMGLSLTIPQIVARLKSVRLVVLSLDSYRTSRSTRGTSPAR